MNIAQAASHFSGKFVVSPGELAARLEGCKAIVFDWDGVFNHGEKDASGGSPFSEIDSMGTNLLRFCRHLDLGHPPVSAIISGERNGIALQFARRESFHAVYCGFRDKKVAFAHLLEQHGLKATEVCFMFDDVLDLAVASMCGLRIMIGRSCNPLLEAYAIRHGLADYVTSSTGGQGAVREASELLIGISGYHDDVVGGRMAYHGPYEAYLTARNAVSPDLYLLQDGRATKSDHL